LENEENKNENIQNDAKDVNDIINEAKENLNLENEVKEELKSEAKEPDSIEPSKEQELQAKIDDLDDRYKRLFAEFENYKKRTQKESFEKYNFITADVITKVLPIMDNLQNAVNAKTEDKAYQDGVRMVLNQFDNCFKSLNVEEIVAAPGTKFDPELHDAVQHIDDPEKGASEIVQEFRKGYKIGNKVIRHSMVIVANWFSH